MSTADDNLNLVAGDNGGGNVDDDPYVGANGDVDDEQLPPLDGDRFRIPLGPGGGFGPVVAALSRKLSSLAVPTHHGAAFLSVTGRPARFTQCLVDVDEGAWVECVSNRYLRGRNRLTRVERQAIGDLGYDPPGRESPNFSASFDQPVDWDAVARLLVAPFIAVFECHDHDTLELVVNPYFHEREEDEDDEEQADAADHDQHPGAAGTTGVQLTFDEVATDDDRGTFDRSIGGDDRTEGADT